MQRNTAALTRRTPLPLSLSHKERGETSLGFAALNPTYDICSWVSLRSTHTTPTPTVATNARPPVAVIAILGIR